MLTSLTWQYTAKTDPDELKEAEFTKENQESYMILNMKIFQSQKTLSTLKKN